MCLQNIVGILTVIIIIAIVFICAVKYKFINILLKALAITVGLIVITYLCCWLITYQC